MISEPDILLHIVAGYNSSNIPINKYPISPIWLYQWYCLGEIKGFPPGDPLESQRVSQDPLAGTFIVVPLPEEEEWF